MGSKLASLHAGLIARKGEAAPALAHQSYSYVDAPRPGPLPIRREAEVPERRSLGPGLVTGPRPWTGGLQELESARLADVQTDAKIRHTAITSEPAPEATPERPVEPVVAAPMPHDEPVPHDEPRPFRLTLRLTADQRRRLRIAAARENTSLQMLMSEALDGHLDRLCACELRECSCLARERSDSGA